METPRAITWEAPEHHHIEKGNDWYYVLGIIVFALVVIAIIFDNVLFALVLGLAGGALAMAAAQPPSIIPYAVTVRGIRVGDRLYPFSTLHSYHIDEEDRNGPQLLVLSKRKLLPLIVMPLPEPYIDDIEDILREKLKEEFLEESLFVKVLELFGF